MVEPPACAATGRYRLRNCPFDPLSRLYTPLVCGVGQAVISSIVQGIGADQLRVARDERLDLCCGLVTLPSQSNRTSGG